MAEKEIGGNLYSSMPMPPMVQKRVLTRIGPAVLPVLKTAISSKGRDILKLLNSKAAAGEEDGALDMMGLMAEAAQAVLAMPDEESDYVIATCLSYVQRRDPTTGVWSGVWNKAATGPGQPLGGPQFADIDLPAMMKLVFMVLAENFSGFFPASLSTSPGGPLPAKI